MGDLVLIGQLVDTLNEAIVKLEAAREGGNSMEINDSKILILDIHNKIAMELSNA